jgi:surface antigen Omp85-like protein
MFCFAALAFLVFAAIDQETSPTRSAELRAQREAKSRQLKPQQQSKAERFLFKAEDSLLVQRLFNPPRGIYVRWGGLGEGSGLGAGPGYRYSTGQFDFRVSAAGSLKGYFGADASLILPGAIKDGPFVQFYARRRDLPQEDFFGLGPDSVADNRTNFALRDTLGRVTGGFRAGGFRVGVHGSYLDPSVGSGTDNRMPSTDEVFSPLQVPGLDRQPAFTIVEPFVEFVNADPERNPTIGTKIRLTYSRFSDRDFDQFSFQRWDVDAQQYIPFFNRARTLALRVVVASADAESGNEVPFYLQPVLGGAYTLRGFRTFRFRDRSAALFQAEYRWRINELVHGALFYDTGAVAPTLSDLGKLERDYGFGIRIGGRGGIAFRTDIAFGSGEGTRYLIRWENVF